MGQGLGSSKAQRSKSKKSSPASSSTKTQLANFALGPSVNDSAHMIMEKGISLNPPNRVASPDEAPPASRKDVSSSSPSDMFLSDSASRILVESKVLEAR